MDSDNRVSRMLPQPTPRHALRIKRRLLRTPNGLSFMESPVAKPPRVRTVSRWRPDGISTTRSVSDKRELLFNRLVLSLKSRSPQRSQKPALP